MNKLQGITAVEFDRMFPVGSSFKYFPSNRYPEFQEVKTRSLAWALGHGAVVVSVDGRAGGVSIEHLELISVAAAPAVIVRDQDGFWLHPAAPDFDEGTEKAVYLDWFTRRGLEVSLHCMGADSEALESRWNDGDMSAVMDWQPSPPAGEGWFLWSIFDTEDGPHCEFVRRVEDEAGRDESPRKNGD